MRYLQLLLFILVPIANYYVNATPEGQEMFERNPDVLIQPAGYAFAIWGPIFLGMIIYSIFQIGKQRVESSFLTKATWAGISAALASMSFPFIALTNIQWLGFINLLWHLGSLCYLFINLREQITLENNPNTKWYYLPTQMYLGWIAAATAVSAALFLREMGVSFSLQVESIITAVVIFALHFIGIRALNNKAGVLALVLVWALIALWIEQRDNAWVRIPAIIVATHLTINFIAYFRKGKPLLY